MCYGTKATWYGIAGSASNCISACRALGGENQLALVQRNSHRAIVHGFRITGATVAFINPEYDTAWDVFRPVTFVNFMSDFVRATADHGRAPTVVCITSPSYEGLIAELPAIAAFCKTSNVRLLVDGAHGSILPFLRQSKLKIL